MKARRLLAILERMPLSYRVVRRAGSHRQLRSDDYPPVTFAFHDRITISPNAVRKALIDEVGLTEEKARKLL